MNGKDACEGSLDKKKYCKLHQKEIYIYQGKSE